MDNVSFTCMHCESRLKAPRRLAGKVANCPKCREKTVVPGPEDAGVAYALAGESAPIAGGTAPIGRPVADIWRPLGYEGLSARSKSRLAEARSAAGDEAWAMAASILNDLFRAVGGGEMTPENAAIRTPLSHCLTRWAVAVLDEMEDDPDANLSRPMRRLLDGAAEKQKWGGAFDIAECGICHAPMKSIAGRPYVRTTVGTAYLCCARPTRNDQRIVGEVSAVWQRLSLAAILDDRNQDAWQAMKQLPAWQLPLRVEKFSLDRGNAWVRWDAETDGLLSELVEKAIERSVNGAIGGILGDD